MGRFGEKTREARLRWYGHVLRKDDGYIGRRMLRMELPGKRKQGRPKRRLIDAVIEDIAVVEGTEEGAEDWTKWTSELPTLASKKRSTAERGEQPNFEIGVIVEVVLSKPSSTSLLSIYLVVPMYV